MPIYTKKGDQGTSSLINKITRPKSDLAFECIGTIDELNSAVGIIVSQLNQASVHEIKELLLVIQNYLFAIGSNLAGNTLPDLITITSDFEHFIDSADTVLSPLNQFILPGGCSSAAFTHQARTIARRTERTLVKLSQETNVDPTILIFFNRLSDVLFTIARLLNYYLDGPDVFWEKQKSGLPTP